MRFRTRGNVSSLSLTLCFVFVFLLFILISQGNNKNREPKCTTHRGTRNWTKSELLIRKIKIREIQKGEDQTQKLKTKKQIKRQKYETGITWRNQETKSQKHQHGEVKQPGRRMRITVTGCKLSPDFSFISLYLYVCKIQILFYILTPRSCSLVLLDQHSSDIIHVIHSYQTFFRWIM